MTKFLSFTLVAALLLAPAVLCAQEKKPTDPPKEIAPAVQIFFDINKSEIKDSEKPKLNQLVKDMKGKKEFQIWLTGHADSTGTAERNNELSKERVDEVYNYLADAGIPEDAMDAKYFSSARPLPTSAKASDKAASDRRVEISFYEKPKPIEKPKPKPQDTCTGHDTTFSAGDGIMITMNKCEYTQMCKSNPSCIEVTKLLEVEDVFDSGLPLVNSKGDGFVWGGIITTKMPGDTCLPNGAKIVYGLDKDAYKRVRLGAMKKKGEEALETDRGVRVTTGKGKEETAITVPVNCPGTVIVGAPAGKSKMVKVKDKTRKAQEMYLVSNSPVTIIPGLKKGNKFYFNYGNVPSPKLYIRTADGDLIKDIDLEKVKKTKKVGSLNKGYKLKKKHLST